MDLDIGGAGRVMQGNPDPSPLENSNFLTHIVKLLKIGLGPAAVTPHTPQWQKKKFAVIRS